MFPVSDGPLVPYTMSSMKPNAMDAVGVFLGCVKEVGIVIHI